MVISLLSPVECTSYATTTNNLANLKKLSHKIVSTYDTSTKDIVCNDPVTSLPSYLESNSTVILNGNGNLLSSPCLHYSSGSLIINGDTVFKGYVSQGSSIAWSSTNTLVFNANITFDSNSGYNNKYALLYTNINNMHILKDPAKYIHIADNYNFGTGISIKNLYLDYIADASSIQSSKKLHLSSSDCNVAIDNIYFTNPNCNYTSLSIKNISASNMGKATVYGYGGASAYNSSGNKVLSKEMYEEYTSGYGTFVNYVKGFQTDTASLPTNVNLGKNQSNATISFKNINVTGTYLDTQDPVNGSTYTRKMTKKTSWDTTNTNDSQYQYGIYVPVKYNSVSSDSYTYSADGTEYALLEGDTCQLPAGTHTYYIEAGGNFEKHTVTVNACRIEEITSITLKNENMEVGNTLTADDVTVKVRYTNDSNEYTLDSSEFSLENPDITREGASNVVTVVVPRKNNTSLSKTITVNGYVDNVTGFEVECDVTEKLAGTTFSVGNITLKNITYGNPDKATTETLKGGYSFISNGVATNTIKIQPGINKISVCYGDFVLKDAIIINGYTAESFTTSCDYQTMYAGTSLFKSDVTLKNIIYNDTKQTKKSSVKDSSFDFIVNGKIVSNVMIHEGTNVIGISYDGKTIEDAITIQGIVYDLKNVEAEYVESYLVDGVPHAKIRITITHQDGTITSAEIDNLAFDSTYQFKTNQDNEAAIFYQGMEFAIEDRLITIDEVRYLGTPTDTKYQVADFYISATYASGAKKDTETNPEIAKDFSTSITTISQQQKVVSLAYKTDSTKKVTATVELDQNNQVVSVYMDNNNGTISTSPLPTPTPATTTPVTDIPNVTSSPLVTNTPENTTSPAVTDTPSLKTDSPATNAPTPETPVVTETVTPTISSTIPTSSAVAETAIPTISPTVSPTATPVVTLVTGNTYTVGNLKYKVTSLTKTKGTVTITGYAKSSSKLRLPSTITIGKHKLKVTAIAAGAFKNCQTLKGTVTIPAYVTSIGNKAFYKCKNITKLVVTSKVRTIGTSAFQYCTKLKAVNLYNCTVKKVGKKAFFNNYKNRKFNMYYGQMAYYKKLLKYKIHFN